MSLLIDAGILIAAYVLGSIPFGLIVVKLINGKDIRTVESGRTGGTNAMRAAGPWAGFLTALLDIFKAAAAAWLAQALTSNVWIHVLAPIAVILGHNYSIFLMERTPQGWLRLRGGAGGAAAGGGAFGLWPPAGFFLAPFALLVFYVSGYASITTLSVGVLSILIFAVRAALGKGPWEYIIYGVLAEILMIWALRPNLKRLREGTERRHGLPAWLQDRKQAKAPKDGL
jgi:glycerol-3-phosphate acyltransferase PlsY